MSRRRHKIPEFDDNESILAHAKPVVSKIQSEEQLRPGSKLPDIIKGNFDGEKLTE